MPDNGIVHIAWCPKHGLHGERQECFLCGGPVEQIPMVHAVAVGEGNANEARRLQSEVYKLAAERDELQTRLDAIDDELAEARKSKTLRNCGAVNAYLRVVRAHRIAQG